MKRLPDFDRDESCLCTALKEASRKLTNSFDDALAPSGLNLGQFRALKVISQQNGLAIKQIAVIIELERSTVSRNVQVLASRGLVEYHPGNDGREQLVAITDAGTDALVYAHPLWLAAQLAAKRKLGADATATLLSVLKGFQ